MAIKLKNILRNPWVKTLFYLTLGFLCFFYCYYTINNITCDENANYFKNFAYESFLVDNFYASGYVDTNINSGLIDLGVLSEELRKEEHRNSLKHDSINFIDEQFGFKESLPAFAYDKKYSYYFENSDGYAFASENYKGLNKKDIKNKIKNSLLYFWYDYRMDKMGMDGESSAINIKAKINNRDTAYHTFYKGYENINVIYLAYNDDVLKIAIDEWNLAYHHYENMKKNMWALFLSALFVFILLIAGAGRKANSDEKIEFFFDPIFVEVKLLLLLPAYILTGEQVFRFLQFIPSEIKIVSIITALLICALMYGSLIIFMSIIRNLKSEHVKNRFLITWIALGIVGIFKFIAEFFKAIFDTKNLSDKNINKKIHRYIIKYIGISVLLMFAAFIFLMNRENGFFLLGIFIELVITAIFIVKIKKLLLLSNQAFEQRVQEVSKSEKTKTELITNVSHDLKTPLTSIIGYIDLLKKEELGDVAKDYVKILEQKSDKLKDIIEDLFMLSKSESGSMDLNMEIIDLKKLVNQALANLEDKIIQSGMQIKTTLPDREVCIKSDGIKLYRVMQNLIDNALKYSLKGTRIFIDLDISVDNKAKFRIKNTSSYEMNFTKEEITQRFVRGDKSRTKDGSGLGLAIAESFTSILGGQFDLIIDGDVFIVDLFFDMING